MTDIFEFPKKYPLLFGANSKGSAVFVKAHGYVTSVPDAFTKLMSVESLGLDRSQVRDLWVHVERVLVSAQDNTVDFRDYPAATSAALQLVFVRRRLDDTSRLELSKRGIQFLAWLQEHGEV